MHITVGNIYVYQIVIFSTPLYGRDPAILTGFTSEKDATIYISACMPKKKRETIFRHEAIHAWEFHLPPAGGRENRANWTSTVWAAVDKEIQSQGGWEMLEKLRTREEIAAEEKAAAPPELVHVPIEEEEAGRPLLATSPGPSNTWKHQQDAARGRVEDMGDGRRRVPLTEISYSQVIARPDDEQSVCVCAVCQKRVLGSQVIDGIPVREPFSPLRVDRTLYCSHCGHLQHWIEMLTIDGKHCQMPLTPRPWYTTSRPTVEAWLAEHPQALPAEL